MIYLFGIAAFLSALVIVAIWMVLRKLTADALSWSEAAEAANSWHNRRIMERLLDPAEFHLLRVSGRGARRIRQLRARRRAIFRAYLRDLVREFNRTSRELRLVMLESGRDRPDLARIIARQRIIFYSGLLAVEFRLALHALGSDRTPTLDILRPLEQIQTELRQFALAGA